MNEGPYSGPMHSTHPLLPPQLTAEGRPPVENRQDLTVFWTESCSLEKEQGQCTQEEHTDPLQLGLSEAVTVDLTFCPTQQHLSYLQYLSPCFTN